ncbi:hypothetical protein ACQR5T_06480 [Xanthomonas oryzae pv. oryzicola]|uniref:hypothetical protein n=1 Tax=Xanthomonas oryzae TaxID=347 RepID=UPI0012B05A0F|nr:hypothetical protein [Xanthomonas oryzae]
MRKKYFDQCTGIMPNLIGIIDRCMTYRFVIANIFLISPAASTLIRNTNGCEVVQAT